MEEAAPAAAAAAAAPKPFLRRGAGWEARMAAAREGRRYVPRGGTVKDYSQGGEAPLPTRRRPAGSKPPRSPGKVAGGPRKAAGGTYSGQAATAVRQKPTAARAGRSAPPSAAASPARPRPHAAAPTATAPAPIPAAADWTRRLLQRPGGPAAAAGLAPAGEAPKLSARRAEETAALQEFEALESQVLREVHTNSPLPHGSGSKKPASGRGGSALQQQLCSGPPAQQEQPAAPALGAFQAAVEPENWGALLQADDDVFASDGEGGVRSLFGEGSQAQAAAAGIANPLACRAITFGASGAPQPQPAAALGAAQRRWPPPVYCEEEDEGEMHAETSFQDVPSHPASSLVQQYFSRPPAPAPAVPAVAAARTAHRPAAGPASLPGDPHQASAAEAEALEQLQQEVVALQQERARVARMRLELEEAAGRLEQEKAAFEKRKVEDAARFEADRSEELRKLQRDRRVLEKQSRAIMKLPTKQSKEEVAAVEALLAEERRAARAREARHKLTVERLRQQLVELQAKNSELREQVLCLEQQRLAAAWGEVAAGAPSSAGAAAAASGTTAGGPRQGSGIQSTGTGHTAGSTAPLQPPAIGRPSRPSGLPAVRVERVSRSACSTRAAALPAAGSRPGLQQQQGSSQPLRLDAMPLDGMAAVGSAAAEEAIADVELCDSEEVVVWSEEQEGEQPAPDEEPAADGHWDAAAQSAAAGPSAPGGGAMEVQQSWLPGVAAAGRSPPGPALAAAAATDAMSKASSALARFNQLRSSLAQHDSLQGRLASSIASLQPSPPSVPSAVATPPAVDGAAVSHSAAAPSCGPAIAQQDDLRRLGRSLLAGAAPPSAAPAAALSGTPGAPEAPWTAQRAPATSASAACAGGAAADAVVSEVQHPDGRWERLFASGAREQRFANGSAKRSLPSGASLTRFANGDVKKVLPGGTVEYYFAEVASWQVTHPSGVDVFFFPSGQVEAHHPGGVKEVLFPDGAVRKLLPDGRELAISTAHLSREIQAAQPVAALE